MAYALAPFGLGRFMPNSVHVSLRFQHFNRIFIASILKVYEVCNLNTSPMITPAELSALQRTLRDILPDPDQGVFAVLAALKNALPEQTEKYNAVFQLETRLNAVNKDRIRGVLSQEDLDLAYNRITADVLDLIDGLKTTDFDPKTADSSVEDKAGSILYRIPHTMEVEEEHKCVVRLAFDVETVIRNIEITKDTVVKDVRVSEVMEVELLDPNASPCFAIRRLNSVEQFLEKNDYTEWIFFVKPLVLGTLPLLLKVSVIEIINGKERPKEIVLEELINVVTDPSPEDGNITFQSSGYAFSYSNAPVTTTSTSSSKQKYVLPLVLALVVVTGILAAVGMMQGWIPTPSWLKGKQPGDDDRIFWNKTLQTHTRSSFETYLLAYPDGIFVEEARFKIDSLKNLDNLPKEAAGIEPESVYEVEEDSITVESPPPPSKPVKPTKKEQAKTKTQTKPTPTESKPVPSSGTQPPSVATNPEPEPTGKNQKSGFTMISVSAGTLSIKKGECPGGTSVKIQPFKIGKYEITQHDWWSVMGTDPSFHSNCPECPVERVSWNQIQEFIQKASIKFKKKYRLPYEAEWEWAARGGPNSKGYMFAGSDEPNKVAWFNIVQEKTREVGTKRANELGIYDMSGSVWEWCQDAYPPYLHCISTKSDKKALRGGSWADNRGDIKISSRRREKPKNTDRRSGLRLVEE